MQLIQSNKQLLQHYAFYTISIKKIVSDPIFLYSALPLTM